MFSAYLLRLSLPLIFANNGFCRNALNYSHAGNQHNGEYHMHINYDKFKCCCNSNLCSPIVVDDRIIETDRRHCKIFMINY